MQHPTYFAIRKFLKTAGIESKKEYLSKCNELGFPSNPDIMFHDRWQGWPKFLNFKPTKARLKYVATRPTRTATIKRISQRIIDTYPTYRTIKMYLKKLQYEAKTEYMSDAAELGFPLDPEGIYWREWEGWDIFLSTLRSEQSRKSSENVRWVNSWLMKLWTHNHNG